MSNVHQHSTAVSQVERSDFCCSVLRARIAEGHYSKDVCLHNDVTTFDVSVVEGEGDPPVDGYLGGFPCQVPQAWLWLWQLLISMYIFHFASISFVSCFDLSCQGASKAGKKKGMQDDRTSLVKHFFRLWDRSRDPLLIWIQTHCYFGNSSVLVGAFLWEHFVQHKSTMSTKSLQIVIAKNCHTNIILSGSSSS